MEKHKNEFFELFSKHFYNLWDWGVIVWEIIKLLLSNF
jgi:hypothetical protein